MKKFICILVFVTGSCCKLFAQDTTDLMSQLEKEMTGDDKDKTSYATATFKTSRLINGHSVENTGKGVLDVKISHRFGTVNGGSYELFGLDNATMRMGFDYGITNRLMVGIGRSTFEKTYDAFFKLKLLRQSSGKRRMPVTVSYVPTIAYKTIKFNDPDRLNYNSSRLFFTQQLIIGRKFSDNTSFQLMPTYTHQNLVTLATDPNDLLAIGIGGRQKLTKRVSINAEYYYQLPDYKLTGTTNCLSIGFDIETGGHVFQLHFTNSPGMSERTFITETTGDWGKGDILFGFNISRVFTIGKHR
ncbi:MAG TPA: DUF5777 family beta-barrel protein [Ferruginibacter sp.]|nr:DUF5777 family beta-barrel protein [Ferruginibacter sp.]